MAKPKKPPPGAIEREVAPSDDEMKAALLRSGFALENRLMERLLLQKFGVDANTRFVDGDEGRPIHREIDLYARTSASAGDGPQDLVLAELVIEAKDVRSPLAVSVVETSWWAPHAVPHAAHPQRVRTPDGRVPDEALEVFAGLSTHHHYFSEKSLGTKYLAFEPIGGWAEVNGRRNRSRTTAATPPAADPAPIGWRVQQDHDVHGDIIKLGKFVEARRATVAKGLPFGGLADAINLVVFYPIIVVGDGMLRRVRFSDADVSVESAHRISFLKTTFVGDDDRTEHIDIVDETGFGDLITAIRSEVAHMASFLRGRQADIRASTESPTISIDPTVGKSENPWKV